MGINRTLREQWHALETSMFRKQNKPAVVTITDQSGKSVTITILADGTATYDDGTVSQTTRPDLVSLWKTIDQFARDTERFQVSIRLYNLVSDS